MLNWTHYYWHFWLTNQKIQIFSRDINFISYNMLRLIWLEIKVGFSSGYSEGKKSWKIGARDLNGFSNLDLDPRDFGIFALFISFHGVGFRIPKNPIQEPTLPVIEFETVILSMIDISKELFNSHSCSQISLLTVQRKLKLVTEHVWMEEKWTMVDVCVNRRIRARAVRRPLAPQSTDATNESENLMEVLWSAEDLRCLLLTDRQRAKTYQIGLKNDP